MTTNELKRLLLDYEIRSSWWARHMGTDLTQKLAATYFARKVNRKYERWHRSMLNREIFTTFQEAHSR